MGKTLELRVDDGGTITSLKLDTTTEFKDLEINTKSSVPLPAGAKSRDKDLHLMLDNCDPNNKVLEINGVKIGGFFLSVFVDFINNKL